MKYGNFTNVGHSGQAGGGVGRYSGFCFGSFKLKILKELLDTQD